MVLLNLSVDYKTLTCKWTTAILLLGLSEEILGPTAILSDRQNVSIVRQIFQGGFNIMQAAEELIHRIPICYKNCNGTRIFRSGSSSSLTSNPVKSTPTPIYKHKSVRNQDVLLSPSGNHQELQIGDTSSGHSISSSVLVETLTRKRSDTERD